MYQLDGIRYQDPAEVQQQLPAARTVQLVALQLQTTQYYVSLLILL